MRAQMDFSTNPHSPLCDTECGAETGNSRSQTPLVAICGMQVMRPGTIFPSSAVIFAERRIGRCNNGGGRSIIDQASDCSQDPSVRCLVLTCVTFASKKGHFLQHCALAEPQEDAMTPYQSKKRCSWVYRCPRCKIKWLSGNSWANLGQDCGKSGMNVYPHK